MVSILELNNFVSKMDKKQVDYTKAVKKVLGNLNKKVLTQIIK